MKRHRCSAAQGPEAFFAALRRLHDDPRAPSFVVSVLGEQYTDHPPIFAESHAWLSASDRIKHWGMLPRAQYEHVLRSADVVVSTAAHEFQGIAVIEAVVCAAGEMVGENPSLWLLVVPGLLSVVSAAPGVSGISAARTSFRHGCSVGQETASTLPVSASGARRQLAQCDQHRSFFLGASWSVVYGVLAWRRGGNER